jgi:DNA-binding NarL/FixJ family response regulator
MVHLGPSPALSRGMSRVRIVTVRQHHLTHVYTKLGLTSRVQLAQVAARHA